MKTLTGTIKLVVLFLVAAICLLALRAGSAANDPRPFKLKLSDKHELKPGHEGYDQFKAVLDRNQGLYCMKHKEKDAADGTPGKEKAMDNGGCKTLGTASVSDPQRELALICRGSHVTQTATFTTAAQLTAVKKEFVSPPP